jgi:hypothetical protein
MVREVQAEEAAERKKAIAADLRSSLCSTEDGRKAAEEEAARSTTDDIEPCPETGSN